MRLNQYLSEGRKRMKFNIPMVHLRGATLRIAVTTDGSVVAMCGDTVIAQFGAGSVEHQPPTDMTLDVVLGDGKRLNVEIDANDIRAYEYGGEVNVDHPSYRTVLNTEAREFAKTITKESLTNNTLDVVRAALTEVEQLREELRKHKMVC
jgi:hypothetical protein